ncbi:MAG TPA: PPOX class F420-dependent oxidoreductase [Halieaceae bacterium]|nr:PPOX class F420-dependent oxidoreductase [Halieaceae bacterium]
MKNRPAAPFERCAYLSFATRKRNGEFVPTPVWFAPDNGVYYLFSAGDAGKVKRLRNFSSARIAPCTVSGRLTGEWHEANAYLVDSPAEIALALAALRRKYGWQMRGLDALSRLGGKLHKRAYIRVEPAAPDA